MSDSVSDCPEQRSAVTDAEVEALVRGICFKTGPPRTLGVEVEWLVHELREPWLPVPPERLRKAYAALRPLPCDRPSRSNQVASWSSAPLRPPP